MSLGINTTYAKFFHENDDSPKFFLNFFFFRSLTAICFSITFWISLGLYHNSLYLYSIVMFNLFGAVLTEFFVQHYQSQERFKVSVLISSFCQYIRCLCFLVCFANGWYSIEALLCGYFVGYTLTGIALIAKVVPPKIIDFKNKKETNLFFSKSEMIIYIKYGTWISISSLLTVLILYLDGVMLFHMQGAEASAAYALAFKCVEPIILLNDAVSKVLIPKLFKKTSIEDTEEYLKKVNRYLIPISILIAVIGLLVVDPVFEYLFHGRYVLSPIIIKILILTTSMGLYFNQHNLIFYKIGKHHWFTINHVFQLCGIVILNLWMIPRFGAVGAAWNTLIIRLVSNLFYFMYIRNYMLKQKKISLG